MQQKISSDNIADEASRKLQAADRDIVMRTLTEYGLDWTKIEVIGMSDSFTFRISTEAAGSCLLRIHDERFSRAEVLSDGSNAGRPA